MLTSRTYAGEADYELMRALLRAIYVPGRPVYCTLGDLDWWRGTDNDPLALADTRLWLLDDAVVAFAWPSDVQVDLICHPEHRDLEDAMLTWAEGRQAGHAARGEGQPKLRAWAYTSDARRVELLERRGFARGELFLHFRARPIADDPPAPALPPGYRIRHVRGEEDLEARVAVHRDAFAPSRMTLEKHRRVMALPTYRPDLDLVVEAPDGSFASFCIVWHDAANRMGLFEPVGCHSAHRRRGLTRALMYEGLRRLRSLGAEVAHVFSAGGSEPANALYDSAGFATVDYIYAWEKALASDG